MSYTRVIVGTDHSPTAKKAEGVGAWLAEVNGAELVLLNADKDPARTLVSQATDETGDLIVVGSRGMSGAGRLLGSVPNEVSHSARCDVLIVKTTSDQDPRRYRNILIGTDGSETAIQAARRGVDLGRLLKAETTLFFAGHPGTAPIVFAEVQRELPSAQYRTRTASGDPATLLCETALDGRFDLIVLGNRGMTTKAVLGAEVPDKVSHRAPCDLLIVKTVATSIASLRNGEGTVIEGPEDKIAAYKDPKGRLHKFSARCKHMGCIVGWNSSERTWDCPCHGSRYAATGEVINGPAVTGLTPVEGD